MALCVEEIEGGHAAQFMLLGAVYGEFGGYHAMAAAGLDLDETEDIAIPADEIDFATAALASPVAREDGVALAAQKGVGQLLAPAAGA